MLIIFPSLIGELEGDASFNSLLSLNESGSSQANMLLEIVNCLLVCNVNRSSEEMEGVMPIDLDWALVNLNNLNIPKKTHTHTCNNTKMISLRLELHIYGVRKNTKPSMES